MVIIGKEISIGWIYYIGYDCGRFIPLYAETGKSQEEAFEKIWHVAKRVKLIFI